MLTLFIVLACGGDVRSTAEPAPTPTTEPAPAPVVEAPSDNEPAPEEPVAYLPGDGDAQIEALAEAGACTTDGASGPKMVLHWSVGTTQLYAVQCAAYAYQSEFQWWTHDANGYSLLEDTEGDPVQFLGYPKFDPTTRQATWLTKARGVGDCGDWYRYRFEAGIFHLEEHRHRDCASPDGEMPPSPSQWPLVD